MSTVLLSSRWHKRILFPIWTLRMALTGCLLTYFISTLDWISQKDYFTNSILAVAIVIMILLVAVLMIDVFSIVVLARNRLYKSWFLIFQAAISKIWALLLLMLVIEATMAWDDRLPLFLIFFVLLFVSSLSITIWAIIIYRRSRPGNTTRSVEPAPEMTMNDPDPFSNDYALPPPPYTASSIRYA